MIFFSLTISKNNLSVNICSQNIFVISKINIYNVCILNKNGSLSKAVTFISIIPPHWNKNNYRWKDFFCNTTSIVTVLSKGSMILPKCLHILNIFLQTQNVSPFCWCITKELEIKGAAPFLNALKIVCGGDRLQLPVCEYVSERSCSAYVWVCHFCVLEGTMDVLTARAHAHLLNGWKAMEN